MSDRITVSRSGGVADVRLNRPDKLNALDSAMFTALVETADALASDSSLRAVVLSGEGRSFCAGLDFASFGAMAGDTSGEGAGDTDSGTDASSLGAEMEGRITHRGQQAVWGWAELPVPVIAAVTGHALGGGCQLALGADIRFARPDATLSVMELRWGLIPDMTGTQTLVSLVGLDVAKELVYTAKRISGTEAHEIGLVTHLSDDPVAEATALAETIAAKSPHAIRAAKRLMNAAPKLSYADGFAAERLEISQLVGSPNQVEAVMANMEKRPPAFTD